MSALTEIMTKKLQTAFAPEHLEVHDQSHLHAGHAGAREGGNSHFAVEIKAAAFTGKSPLARHRAINEVLAEELAGPIHALTIKASGV
jgi:BolA protein